MSQEIHGIFYPDTLLINPRGAGGIVSVIEQGHDRIAEAYDRLSQETGIHPLDLLHSLTTGEISQETATRMANELNSYINFPVQLELPIND